MRRFLAIFPPDECLEPMELTIRRWQEKLDRQGLKWVPMHKLHMTLTFLGEVDGDSASVPEDWTAIEGICAQTRPFKVSMSKLGCFPDFKRPGVLWWGIESDDADVLADLHLKFADALNSELDDPFVPHVTLARMRPASRPFGMVLSNYFPIAKYEEAAWTVQEICLVETQLDNSYKILHRFRLGN